MNISNDKNEQPLDAMTALMKVRELIEKKKQDEKEDLGKLFKQDKSKLKPY